MRHLLSHESAELLAQFAWSRILLAFDFDGTLAPIVGKREEAQMRSLTSNLFSRVCGLYACAVISGRSKDDVSTRLGSASVKYVVGNHGLEPGASLDEFEEEIASAHRALGTSLAQLVGVEMENKRYSLALHYRRSRHKRAARTAIIEAVEALPVRMRVVHGKLVINVVPERAPNKGDALLDLRKVEQADTALYIGDDVTDEDVFELDQPGRLLTVRVGASRSSSASYFLRDQSEIDRLLTRLVELRTKATGS